MLIKHTQIQDHLKKKSTPIYLCIGTDQYLMLKATQTLQAYWQASDEFEKKRLTLNSVKDWQNLFEEANSYSLFQEKVMIEAQLEKKTLEATAKKMLLEYLHHPNSKCMIVICAPALTQKALGTLSNIPEITVIQMIPFTPASMQEWIKRELMQYPFQFSSEIPALIQQHTEGNTLACAQVLEKLSLIYSPQHTLTQEEVLPHLTHQCDYSLYELADSFLTGDQSRAIRLIRQAYETRTEATLILWLLTQEIRLLIQLQHTLSQGKSLQSATQQLHIWPKRVSYYEKALKEVTTEKLFQLLQFCQKIDQSIKIGQNKSIWYDLENLALSLFTQVACPN